MRITIRFNDEEAAKLKQLMALTNIDNDSTALKFSLDWTLNHIKVVTDSLVAPNWDVLFRRKSKTYQGRMKVYR